MAKKKLDQIAVPEFKLPELSEMTLEELKDIGHQLNGQRQEVLNAYKEKADLVQKAIVKQEKKEIAERKAKDPDYDKKLQGIGGKLPTK